MRTGDAPIGPVTAPGVAVALSGLLRAVDSVSVTRDLPSDLPASVTGGGGITAATGDATWGQVQAVKLRDDSPWSVGVVPMPGDTVTVDADAGAGSHRVFTGAVDHTTGGTGRASTSSLIDHIYRLNRRVSVEALTRRMYPRHEGDPFRHIGLTSIYVVDRVMRACGYYVTPPAEFDVAVSVPLQTSVWPEVGLLAESSAFPGSSNAHAAFVPGERHLWAHDFSVVYEPAGTPKPVTTATQLSVSVGPDHAGAFDLHARYGVDNTVTLTITAAGDAQARLNGTLVVSRAGVLGQRVSLLVKDGTWTIRTSGGATSSATQAVSGSTVLSSVTSAAALGARVAGLMVSWPNTPAREHASTTFTPNARVRPGSVAHGLVDATPAIVNRRALDVLLEISRAMCSPMWFDEDGTLQWAGSDVLRSQAAAATVTARDSLLALDWRVTLDHVRSTTSVSWSQPRLSVGRFPWVTLWEGRRESLTPGDELREFIEVPSGEDWVGVNLPGTYLGTEGMFARFNQGKGTWIGGHGVNSAGDATDWFTTAHGSASVTFINHRTFLHSMNVTNLPVGAENVSTDVWLSGGPWPKWERQALPILRGYGKVTWNDTTTDALPINNGPADRPELVHDAGPWVQRGEDTPQFGIGDNPARLANWIATQVQTPVPEVTGFEIMPDPRIQLGDVINVTDPDNLGVAFTALVVGVNTSQDGPEQSMNLSLRVIAANPTHTTYDQLQTVWAGANYAALEAAWSGDTYSTLEDNPLEVTP